MEIDLVAKLVEWPTYYIAVTVLDTDGGDFTICTNFIQQDVRVHRENPDVTPTTFSEVDQTPIFPRANAGYIHASEFFFIL
jgi:hypothetical protein